MAFSLKFFWEVAGIYEWYLQVVGTLKPYLLYSNLFEHFALTGDGEGETLLLQPLIPSCPLAPKSHLVKPFTTFNSSVDGCRVRHVFWDTKKDTNILLSESRGLLHVENRVTIKFSLNVFTEFNEFGDKKYYILKILFQPATSCVRDQDATTAPVRCR